MLRSGIQRDGSTILRPLAPGYRSVHLLLNHLQQAGFVGSPRVLGVEGNHERLTFLSGETYDDVQSGPIATQSALVSAAQLLRQFHHHSADFLQRYSAADDQWLLPAQQPADVICHGDYAPYNVVLKGDLVVGMFDFDAAHPGSRLWDLAYAVYCWAPLKSLSQSSDQTKLYGLKRARQFLDAYGLAAEQRATLVEMMVLRLQALVTFMNEQANSGDEKFTADMKSGHCELYLRDIDYLQRHAAWLVAGIEN